jgi:hypothetical protein
VRQAQPGIRKCAVCKATVGPDRPDACMGTLPGVIDACCGHGVPRRAYIVFESELVIRGFRIQHRPNQFGESLP